jgi:hypothetical protein
MAFLLGDDNGQVHRRERREAEMSDDADRFLASAIGVSDGSPCRLWNCQRLAEPWHSTWRS